ncbi:urease accessory protein UreD [Amycolatopsis endophytica]|uniref:Urease accessory protein UreD n=1 Tax=Amycolatopsis endophytica TaxID=860233 RepID=A0A853B355_9PSEU|nr:urease accessory protein UreD [Amycolatopsis endophytica]NYI89255.1 urease accessory protein [Amycolatopsis endophytica]
MKAHARLVAEVADGRTVLRELRSMAPLTLVPRRGAGPARVHLVSSATSPLGGDELVLEVFVGPGADLRLSGVAATLALPGPGGADSTSSVRVEVAGSLEYLPEPTVVTARARHTAELVATLDEGARFRTREVLVLGRAGEAPGRFTTSQRVTLGGRPVLDQTLTVGDPALDASLAVLAGHRVLATELLVGGSTVGAASGDWWAVTPLPGGGGLTTALASDAVTAEALLRKAPRG